MDDKIAIQKLDILIEFFKDFNQLFKDIEEDIQR